MSVDTLQQLFHAELKDAYDAEHRLTTALTTLAEATTQEDLAQALTEHEAETEEQIDRLETAFDAIGEDPERTECEAVVGMVEETEEFIEEMDPSEEVLNRYAMAAAQKTERYEITSYENMLQWAQEADMDETVIDAIQQNLQEEEAALETLQTQAEEFDYQAILA